MDCTRASMVHGHLRLNPLFSCLNPNVAKVEDYGDARRQG